MEWVEAELKPKLEKLWGEIDEELVAQIMLDLENMWEIDEVLAAQIMFDFKKRGVRQWHALSKAKQFVIGPPE